MTTKELVHDSEVCFTLVMVARTGRLAYSRWWRPCIGHHCSLAAVHGPPLFIGSRAWAYRCSKRCSSAAVHGPTDFQPLFIGSRAWAYRCSNAGGRA